MLSVCRIKKIFFLTFFLLISSLQASQAGEDKGASPFCNLNMVIGPRIPLRITLDDKTQNINLESRFAFEKQTPQTQPPYILSTEVTSLIFDDFLKAYHAFLMKRVGPASRCDKLEIGKVQVNAEKGTAYGYFVGRYTDTTCMHLRFFEPTPGEIDREMFVIYSAKGITGAKNTFTPAFKDGKFYIHVKTTYEPIEEPSIFGRGGATLSGLYKEDLTGFLSDPDFTKILANILPKPGSDINKSGFKFSSAAFLKNRAGKIQLTFMHRKAMTEENACTLKENLKKAGFSEEK